MTSKFEAFTLELANGGSLSGLVYIPNESPPQAASRPLLVLCHGGGCHAGYYDLDIRHSAIESAEAFAIPVVSINRPCYKDTSSFFPIPQDSSFHQETGRWEHDYIFPALWEQYGIANHCTALVAMGHSMATPGLLIAASLHSRDVSPKYPLAALIISGWGSIPCEEHQHARLGWSAEQSRANRHLLMLSDPTLHTAEPDVIAHLKEQTVEPPPEEAEELSDGLWWTEFPGIAEQVKVPIMFGLGEHDWLWKGTQQNAKDFAAFFLQCPRFEEHIVPGAPHAIEWSFHAREWYEQCFKFAVDVPAFTGARVDTSK